MPLTPFESNTKSPEAPNSSGVDRRCAVELANVATVKKAATARATLMKVVAATNRERPPPQGGSTVKLAPSAGAGRWNRRVTSRGVNGACSARATDARHA